MRFQAVITELVFEHALRIRMKADTESSSAAPSNATTAVGTPDNASQLGVEGEGSESGDAEAGHSATASSSTAVAPTSGSAKGKAKSTSEEQPKEVEPEKPVKKATGGHLVGRINNLVTSDLNNFEGLGMNLVFFSTRLQLLSRHYRLTII